MKPIKVITFGRSTKNNIVLNDNGVSRVHCQIIQFDDGTFAIADFNSTNGTFVNGVRVSGQVPLKKTDHVRVAGTKLVWLQYFASSHRRSRLPLIIGLVIGLLVLIIAVIIVLIFYGKKKTQENWSFPEPIEKNDELPVDSPLYYKTNTLFVDANESLESAFLKENGNYNRLIQEYNLGGGKLLAEMSADAEGKNRSRYFVDTRVNIRPLPLLKIEPIMPDDDNPPDEIVKMIYGKKIWVGDNVICGRSQESTKGVFEIDIPITSLGEGCVVDIPQGQMVEVLEEGVQNLVVTCGMRVCLNPGETITAKVYLDCAARHRGDPIGHKVRLAPFKMNASSEVFSNQQSVWNHLESQAKYPVTFFVRPRLNNTNVFFNKKDYGHAFVRIPGVGITGYGRIGSWFGGEGNISDHAYYFNRNYGILDSCTVMVTEEQLRRIVARYNELVSEKKRYYLAYNDCTSFVMDIADAGNIQYGSRAVIQLPSEFLDGLKLHN